ncbi:LysR family transcriptional regulator [Stakelama sp. CBK3Z-3]|uniref:LysR family transcriptional regulator n=1 Tax=Stakelama flava TaxID=2860338 RepID=A0ABS6XMP4_9SPHN|nr:LysR family transcriptional regulator [Stakelama flava]MBW4331472.1 LysR family transcriptional regulator [Stakelama flava]
MSLPDFEGWAIFACVVEHRSFSGAAQAIGISKATVSKAITRLEQRLGTNLFHRTSRKLTLTESGAALAERAKRILGEAQCAEEEARQAAVAPSGTVRIAAPLTFGLSQVAPAIADFLAEYPQIHIDLKLSDATVDIVADGFDIALRIADLPDSSLRARRLAPVRIHTVAAPAYLDRHGRPSHPSELTDHRCFVYSNTSRPDLWQYYGPEGEEAGIRVEGPLIVDNGRAMLPALRRGLGIARLPDFIVDELLNDGSLEAVLTGWDTRPIALHMMTPPGTLRPARVTLLMDFLAERFRAREEAGR